MLSKKKTCLGRGKSVNNKISTKNLARENNVGPYILLAKTFLCAKNYTSKSVCLKIVVIFCLVFMGATIPTHHMTFFFDDFGLKCLSTSIIKNQELG